MKNRIERINQLIREKVAEILSRDIFVKGSLITVQEVSTSKDLNHAKIKVSVMPFSESAKVMKILEKQAPTIQAKLNSVVRIKFVPRIKFYLDVSEEKAGRVEEILRNITK
ncbi:MAG: 30S ribosome-binding factor RbfA [bacterium]|nr:30S ribosome-binding factor RbfA [bacterium]